MDLCHWHDHFHISKVLSTDLTKATKDCPFLLLFEAKLLQSIIYSHAQFLSLLLCFLLFLLLLFFLAPIPNMFLSPLKLFLRGILVIIENPAVNCWPYSSWPDSRTWYSLLKPGHVHLGCRTQLQPDFPEIFLVLLPSPSFLQDYPWFCFFFLTCFLPPHFLFIHIPVFGSYPCAGDPCMFIWVLCSSCIAGLHLTHFSPLSNV